MSVPLSATTTAHSIENESMTDAGGTEIRRPLFWLFVILLISLGLRLWSGLGEFQQDEYRSLYAIVERQGRLPGHTATSENLLTAVPNWKAVRERSILPFGIENPYPIYHYILYAFVKLLGVNEFALRLPSLLAGLGCVAGIFFLCRRLINTEIALVAALLAAVDPMQVATSMLVRPFAIANLVCVGSFFCLILIKQSCCVAGRSLAALGYSVCMAFLGYLNPVLMFAGVAHLGMVGYWYFAGAAEGAAVGDDTPWKARLVIWKNALVASFRENRKRATAVALMWLAGCGLAVLFMLPQLNYIEQVQRFASENRDVLSNFPFPSHYLMRTFLLHNSTFLLALLVVSIAGYVLRRSTESFSEGGAGSTPESEVRSQMSETGRHEPTVRLPAEGSQLESQHATTLAVAPPHNPPLVPPLPDVPDVLWLGRLWLFLPQVVPFVLSFLVGLSVYQSPYLSFTMLGGAILLAHWATRDRSRDIRLGLCAALVLTVFLWGLTKWSLVDTGLATRTGYAEKIESLDRLEAISEKTKQIRWQDGDVLLVRGGFVEADLLPVEQNTERLREAVAAPYTIGMGAKDNIPKPVIVLSHSNFRNSLIRTKTGQQALAEEFYTEELARQLRQYKRFWYVGLPKSDEEHRFLACFLPWLSDALNPDRKGSTSVSFVRVLGQTAAGQVTLLGGPPFGPLVQMISAAVPFPDLKVARNRPEEQQRYFYVTSGVLPETWMGDYRPDDFKFPILIQRLDISGAGRNR